MLLLYDQVSNQAGGRGKGDGKGGGFLEHGLGKFGELPWNNLGLSIQYSWIVPFEYHHHSILFLHNNYNDRRII